MTFPRIFLRLAPLLGVFLAVTGGFAAALAELPNASASQLPRWRGFNLLEQFTAENAGPFHEEDFRLISEWGFNFVRLPLDYRIWIRNGDPAQIDASKLTAIDQAVAWGKKYGIHVCLNFHRAPGYSVNNHPKEARDLWTDPGIQEICAQHWAFFARRYRDSDNAHLSFNLLNEPADVDVAKHEAVIRKLVAAIRAEDPKRLIIADGLEYGTMPVKEIASLGVAQSTRGYRPFGLTHYKAEWVGGAAEMPLPTWPIARAPQLLHARKELHSALTLEGDFSAPTTVRLHVTEVSYAATLRIAADGQPVLTREFKPGAGKGEWKKAIYNSQYSIWQNLYDLDVAVEVPSGTKVVTCELTGGDWLRMSEIALRPKDRQERVLKLSALDFETKHEGVIHWQPESAAQPFIAPVLYDRTALQKEGVDPWLKFAREKQVGIIVGEWGAYDKTPDGVVMAWMEDCLKNYQESKLGWALWNFRGSFGVLDSERGDVNYEDFHGHKLDRKMLELLQRY